MLSHVAVFSCQREGNTLFLFHKGKPEPVGRVAGACVFISVFGSPACLTSLLKSDAEGPHPVPVVMLQRPRSEREVICVLGGINDYCDGGHPSEFLAAESDKGRRHFDTLGIGGRGGLDFLNGPQSITANSTFWFLHRRLNWPE